MVNLHLINLHLVNLTFGQFSFSQFIFGQPYIWSTYIWSTYTWSTYIWTIYIWSIYIWSIYIWSIYICSIHSIWVIFNNFLIKCATDRSTIRSDQKRLFFAIILYPLSFFANTPFKKKDRLAKTKLQEVVAGIAGHYTDPNPSRSGRRSLRQEGLQNYTRAICMQRFHVWSQRRAVICQFYLYNYTIYDI